MRYRCIHILLLCLLCLSGCRIESVEQHEAVAQKEIHTVEKAPAKEESQRTSSKQEEVSDLHAKEKSQQEQNKPEITQEEQASSKDQNQTSHQQDHIATDPKKADTSQSNQPPMSTPPAQNQEPPAVSEPKQAYVTISIDMLTLLDRMSSLKENKRAYVPSDGWLLHPIQVEIQEGDTVFSVLQRITSHNRIPMEYQGSSANAYQTVYIQGIAHIYEFDCGNLSGWMYFVNGAYVNVGASAYKVKAGDNITWRYTCESGKDL